LNVDDVARYARQIALPEIGPEGQSRIGAARVLVVGGDLTAETATTYLRAAGVENLFPVAAVRAEGQGAGAARSGGSDATNWRALLSNVDLVVRSGFDDTPLDAEVARLGLPAIFVRATPEAVDLVSFSGRVPSSDARAETPFTAAGTPTTDDSAAVLAGTLAAAEALQLIVRESSGPFSPRIRHMRLPLDGRDPLVQDIGRPA
jgi:hypothetical protein